jgi:hypothetical protein
VKLSTLIVSILTAPWKRNNKSSDNVFCDTLDTAQGTTH